MDLEEGISLIKRTALNIISVDGLEKRLRSGKKLVIKFGADPSRPDLHLGHSVVLRILKVFQDLGHDVVFLIGDYTGMIGDPSGKSKTRPSLTYEETRKNAQTYMEQVVKILDKNKTRIEYNSKWFNEMKLNDVLSLASNYTLARLLERDDFAKRYKEGLPISMHEMFYPLMQGYDSVALGSDVEMGGNDQTFNLLVGRELQRCYGQEPQEVITFPLLVGLDGKEKMSKSLDNYIGIYEEANIMFEKCMKIPDDVLREYFRLTTDVDLLEAEKMIKEDIVNAHVFYATTIVTMYHNAEAAKTAYARYKEVARGGIPDVMPQFYSNKQICGIIEMLTLSKLATSTSEARRLIAGNGIKVNNQVVTNIHAEFDITKDVVVSKGKNKFAKISLQK